LLSLSICLAPLGSRVAARRKLDPGSVSLIACLLGSNPGPFASVPGLPGARYRVTSRSADVALQILQIADRTSCKNTDNRTDMYTLLAVAIHGI
jgi:hypothetical protein